METADLSVLETADLSVRAVAVEDSIDTARFQPPA
jgi:hypothetical protein